MGNEESVRPQTPNRGADDERAAILRKVRAMARQAETESRRRREMRNNGVPLQPSAKANEYLDWLIEWIESRAKRTAKRPGGLGRK